MNKQLDEGKIKHYMNRSPAYRISQFSQLTEITTKIVHNSALRRSTQRMAKMFSNENDLKLKINYILSC
jgi:hypothetical protein